MDRVKKILRPNRAVPDQKETALNTMLYCSHHLYLIPAIGQDFKKKIVGIVCVHVFRRRITQKLVYKSLKKCSLACVWQRREAVRLTLSLFTEVWLQTDEREGGESEGEKRESEREVLYFIQWIVHSCGHGILFTLRPQCPV